MSALASLLVSFTSSADEEQMETGRDTHGQRHVDIRSAASRNATRKAFALFNHRSTIVRWTSAEEASGDDAGRLRSIQPGCDTTGAKHLAMTNKSSCASEDSLEAELVRNDLLSMVTSEGVGRHLVASADIPAGIMLIREWPFAWCLEKEFAPSCCPHCLGEVKGSPTPCAACGRAVFCGSVCSSNARKTWHRDECLDISGIPLEPALSGLSSRCRMALRALRRWRCAGTAPRDPSPVTGTWADGDAGGLEKGGNFTDLEEHYEERSAPNLKVLETEAAIAAVLACGSCEDSGPPTDTRTKDVCGELAAEMLPALCKVNTNGFAVSTLRSSGSAMGQVETLRHAQVAVGLYCVAAMLNHSCRPNAVVTFHGRQIDVIVSRAIRKGEGVTVSYGPLASKTPSRFQRRRSLQEAYFFRCDCTACCARHHSPVGVEIDKIGLESGNDTSLNTQFACTKGDCPGALILHLPRPSSSSVENTPLASSCTRVSCDRCGTDVPTHDSNVLLEEGKEDQKRWKQALVLARLSENEAKKDKIGGVGPQRRGGTQVNPPKVPSIGTVEHTRAKEAAALVLRCTSWRDCRLVKTSMRRAEAHDLMTRLLFVEHDFVGAAKHCELAVAVLERRFSPEDPELGMEIAKLAQICFSAGLANQCMSACQRARISLRLCRRQGDELLGELDMMESYCRHGGCVLSSSADIT